MDFGWNDIRIVIKDSTKINIGFFFPYYRTMRRSTSYIFRYYKHCFGYVQPTNLVIKANSVANIKLQAYYIRITASKRKTARNIPLFQVKKKKLFITDEEWYMMNDGRGMFQLL